MYDHSLHRGRTNICRYCLHAFITEENLKRHIKDCFKINSKQTIKMPNKGEYVKFKNFEKNIELSFMIYTHFEKQNRNESYTKKYQKHIVSIKLWLQIKMC